MLQQIQLSRRVVILSTPLVAVIAACGSRTSIPTADEEIVNSLIATKQSLLPSLSAFPDVANQQQQHIAALSELTSAFPAVSTSAALVGSPSASLTEISAHTRSIALSTTDRELRRLLLIISASDAVHAVVTA